MQWDWIRSHPSEILPVTSGIRPTAFFIIHQRYHERYCIMSISSVCRWRTTLHRCQCHNSPQYKLVRAWSHRWSSHSSCIVMLFSPSPQQDCVNAWNSLLNRALDTSIVSPVMSTCRTTPTASWAFHWIIKSGGPRYLFDELRYNQSSRLVNLLVPAHSLNARACSFFVQCIIFCNDLSPAVKRGGSMVSIQKLWISRDSKTLSDIR
jgi:hypothetical protein